MDTYRRQYDYTQKMQASAQAAQIYTMLTGIDTNKDSTYTLVGTLDERHKDCVYSGYLSYSDKGTLQCTPIVFSGDTASVATCNAVSGTDTHILCDFTDKLTQPSAVDPTTQKLFEKMLSGN